MIGAALSFALLGCTGSTQEPPPPMGPQTAAPFTYRVDEQPTEPRAAAPPAREGGPAAPRAGARGDAPEISRSVGQERGIVVFWPRVIPRDVADATRDLARALQARMRTLVARTFPGRPIDVRPEPERVCPRAGCTAMTVGVLLTRNQNGCVALALVSGPGAAPAKLVAWGGGISLQSDTVPFREPPETQVTVTDYLGCDGFLDEESLTQNESEVVRAMRAVAP
jgi:hypothetical protein